MSHYARPPKAISYSSRLCIFDINESNQYERSVVRHEARNLDAQRTFLNTFENIINRRVNIPEDIRRFQKTLQYARSKVDYVIGEFIYMLPSDMNLWIGNVRNYNNKILISSPSFKIGTNLKINLNVKPKEVEMVKTKPDVKQKRNLTSNSIKNTNKMSNLTSSSNMMLR